MKTVKKTAEYTIYQKRNGRYAVKNAAKTWVNKNEKITILLDAGLIKVTLPAEKSTEDTANDSDENTTEEN